MPYEVLVGSQNPSEVARLNKVESYSKLALDKYNKDNKTKFEFGKFLKATIGRRSGRGHRSYYVTFQGKYMPGFRPKNFQAYVLGGDYIDEGEVKHCRDVNEPSRASDCLGLARLKTFCWISNRAVKVRLMLTRNLSHQLEVGVTVARNYCADSKRFTAGCFSYIGDSV